MLLTATLAGGVGGIALAVDDQAEESAIKAGTGELKGLEDKLKATKAREKSLNAEITALERETRVLSERLISMAARVQAREAKITSGEERLTQLDFGRARLEGSAPPAPQNPRRFAGRIAET